MNKIKFILLAATFGLALAFTFSCSSETGGGGGLLSNTNTYFISEYGIPSGSECCAILDNDDDDGDGRSPSDYTFNEVFELLGEVLNECSGLRLGSVTNITEDSLNTNMGKAGWPPAYRKEFISDLNRRGNNMKFIDTRKNPSYGQYCFLIDYFEKE